MKYRVLLTEPPSRSEVFVVYGLADPREPDRIRYVGCSATHVQRYMQHISPDSTVRGKWMGELRRAGLFPMMVLLQDVRPWDDPHAIEREWISGLKKIGQADMNHAWIALLKAQNALRRASGD